MLSLPRPPGIDSEAAPEKEVPRCRPGFQEGFPGEVMGEWRLEGCVEICQEEKEKYVPGREKVKGQGPCQRDSVFGNRGGRVASKMWVFALPTLVVLLAT